MLRASLSIAMVALLACGCSSFFGSDPEPDVQLIMWGKTEGLSALEVSLGERDFRLEIDEPNPRMDVHAPRVGSLPVQVRLRGASADVLAAAEFTQTFREDRNHWVAGDVGLRRPLGHCIGTLIVIPLSATPAGAVPDTLFLMHGSIPKDAVC